MRLHPVITSSFRHPLRSACLVACCALLRGVPASAQGPEAVMPAPASAERQLPFAIGERLVYSAHAGPGLNGTAEMWIEGPVDVRGVSTMVLRFTFSTRVAFLSVSDNTTSWLDPLRMAAMRFSKVERRLTSKHVEDVAIEPATRRWTASDGHSGTTSSDAPLDELSFIYLVRTLDLADGQELVLQRHFDAERNPTVIRSLGRGSVTTPSGVIATRELEMRVRDARNYQGTGVIRFSITDDECRRPVRIESRIPGAGTVVMVLAGATPARSGCAPGAAAP